MKPSLDRLLLRGFGGTLLRRGDAVRQTLQFRTIQHFGIDHSNKQSLDAAIAEPVHNALHSTARDFLPRLRGMVQKRAVLKGMRQVTLLFKPPEHGAHSGVLEGSTQLFAGLLRCCLSHSPYDREDFAFQLSQFRWIMIGLSVTRHSVTDCNTQDW